MGFLNHQQYQELKNLYTSGIDLMGANRDFHDLSLLHLYKLLKLEVFTQTGLSVVRTDFARFKKMYIYIIISLYTPGVKVFMAHLPCGLYVRPVLSPTLWGRLANLDFLEAG